MVVLMHRTLAFIGFVAAAVCPLVTAARPDGAAPPQEQAQEQAQVVEISAERFSFTPSEFRVKADRAVEIRLRSDDTNHGFRILGTDISIVIPKRGKGSATVTFQPPKPGRYVFECSKLCGAGHAFMRGVLIAE
jgi:cytochrome c oxidase subunit II